MQNTFVIQNSAIQRAVLLNERWQIDVSETSRPPDESNDVGRHDNLPRRRRVHDATLTVLISSSGRLASHNTAHVAT